MGPRTRCVHDDWLTILWVCRVARRILRMHLIILRRGMWHPRGRCTHWGRGLTRIHCVLLLLLGVR